MAGARRDADLAFRLHAADPGTVSRARVDDNDRRLHGIDRDIVWRNDAHERVIGRALERRGRREEFPPGSSEHSATSFVDCARWMFPRSFKASSVRTLRCQASVQYAIAWSSIVESCN